MRREPQALHDSGLAVACRMDPRGKPSCHKTEQRGCDRLNKQGSDNSAPHHHSRIYVKEGGESSRPSRARHHGAWNQPKERSINLFQLLSKSGFLNLHPVAPWGWTLPCCGGKRGHCGTFSCTPGLNQLDARSTLPAPGVTTRSVPRYCQVSPGGQKPPRAESH